MLRRFGWVGDSRILGTLRNEMGAWGEGMGKIGGFESEKRRGGCFEGSLGGWCQAKDGSTDLIKWIASSERCFGWGLDGVVPGVMGGF